MTVSLIHPSRGRPEKAKSTYDYWMSQAAQPENIEHILSLDFSDQKNEQYGVKDGENYVPFGSNSRIVCYHNECVVEATNQAAQVAKGDVLVYLSDDFLSPKGWDVSIQNNFKEVNSQNIPCLLKVDDKLQPFYQDVLTIPIMNRALYSKLGCFWNPLYRSMFVDQDLYHVCKNNNWLAFAPDLIFEHQHYSVGKSQRDETYIRSDANWNSGKEIYERRKLEGFKL